MKKKKNKILNLFNQQLDKAIEVCLWAIVIVAVGIFIYLVGAIIILKLNLP